MTQPTSHYLLIEERLGRPLAELVSERRGGGVAWRRIAVEIALSTGVDVTGEALRLWFRESERAA